MLTPQELNDQSFAKAVFGGYDMAAVDSFLEVVSKDYSDLYKENAVLKNKLKVLVEKVEEYRSTEDAMRMALLNAQKMAKDITEDAELKSKALMDDAERSAQNKIRECRNEIEAEEKRLTLAKAKTAEFIAASGELVADAASVSDWAQEAMRWAVGAGLINGNDDALDPQGSATRAQLAAIMERFVENVVK